MKGASLPQKSLVYLVGAVPICRPSDGIVCVAPWLLCLAACHMSSRDGVDVLALGVVGSWIPPVSRDHPVLGVGSSKGSKGCLEVSLVGPSCTALAGTPPLVTHTTPSTPSRRYHCQLATPISPPPSYDNTTIQHTPVPAHQRERGESEWCFYFLVVQWGRYGGEGVSVSVSVSVSSVCVYMCGCVKLCDSG
ncbi:hypothetical protein F4860DRAFT_210393 [Xylaria cubensis]|nr:hypothetical protein F4860DRAFT_210393 [Xylaria cubensis]